MLGKTFKGLTDRLLKWQTEQLLARVDRVDRNYTVSLQAQVARDIVAGAHRVHRHAHHRNGLAAPQDLLQQVITVLRHAAEPSRVTGRVKAGRPERERKMRPGLKPGASYGTRDSEKDLRWFHTAVSIESVPQSEK